jgi:hypothetical protein
LLSDGLGISFGCTTGCGVYPLPDTGTPISAPLSDKSFPLLERLINGFGCAEMAA